MVFRSYEELPRMKLPPNIEIKISDSTLREGIQMPGVVMKKAHKLKVYEYLHKIGIDKLECFLFNKRDKELAKEMLDIGYERPAVTGWARANKNDIDLITEIDGIKETGILMSVSDTHLFDKIGFTNRDAAEKQYLEALEYTVDQGIKPRLHIEDYTRSDCEHFTFPLIKKAIEIAPNAIIRLCDTLNYGIPFPEVDPPFGVPKVVKKLKDLGVKEIEMHVHDDYGLGIGNTLAGFWYGANWANLTLCGMGERAGIAELEKILLFLVNRIKGFDDKYNLNVINEFADYIQREVKYHIPHNKAVVGKNIFAHESGIHTAGVLKNPFTYEPYPPTLVGAKRTLLIGDSSGREVLTHKVNMLLKKMGSDIQVNKRDKRIREMHNEIHRMYDAEERTSPIDDEELGQLIERYFDMKKGK